MLSYIGVILIVILVWILHLSLKDKMYYGRRKNKKEDYKFRLGRNVIIRDDLD